MKLEIELNVFEIDFILAALDNYRATPEISRSKMANDVILDIMSEIELAEQKQLSSKVDL